MPNMAPIQLLTRYAQDHRDPRNIALHCWGVPLVLAGLVMAARDFGQLGWAVAFTASGMVLKTGTPRCSVPPRPGVQPATIFVPYSMHCWAWKEPCLPVRPWQMTLELLLTRTLM